MHDTRSLRRPTLATAAALALCSACEGSSEPTSARERPPAAALAARIAARPAAAASSARARQLAVRAVRAVHLDQPIALWRDRRRVELHDLVLVRVAVGDPAAFIPMNISDPLFLLDDWVCDVLAAPLLTGEALVLAPRLPSAAPLWVSPRGVLPELLTAEQAVRLRGEAARRQGELATADPTTSAPATTYHDRQQLAQAADRLLAR